MAQTALALVHNGIEYGLMAAYGLAVLHAANAGEKQHVVDAETTPLRDPEYYQYDLNLADIAEVWRRGSVIASFERSVVKNTYVCAASGWVLVDFNAYASQGKPEAMHEIVFPSAIKVMETFGRLLGHPRVLDLPIDEVGLNAWIERYSSDPLQAVRAWVAEYQKPHRKDTGG